MTFLEILKCKQTNLPVHQKTDSEFRKELKDLLSEFGNIVHVSNDLSDSVQGIEFDNKIFKTRCTAIIQGILNAVGAYYQGKPSLAYEKFKQAMHDSNLKGYLNKNSILKEGSNMFRIRVQNGNYALNTTDLLHIPFEKRGIVKTQRYSIPGLPSLYTSNSIYVAWEELGRPSFEDIQAIRLVTTREIKLLDLTTDIYNNNVNIIDNHAHGWQLLYKVITWPLVAACSFKVKQPHDTFKPEYIIPQLLMQWINTNSIDGIMYSSTHLNPKLGTGYFCNYVIPVQTFDTEKGLCPKVTSMFNATDVLPMQLRQFATTTDRFHGQSTISTDVNIDINDIELIAGMRQPYSTTYFGILEHSLKHLKAKPL